MAYALMTDTLPSIDIVNKAIMVRTPYNLLPYHKVLGTGRWVDSDKVWKYPLSFLDASKIDATFPASITRSASFVDYMARSGQETDPSVHEMIPDNIPQPDVRLGDLWAHQLRAFWFANEVGDTLMAMDMGTGKTATTIAVLQNAPSKHKNVTDILVLSPLKVVPVWPSQLEKWCALPYEVQAYDKGSIAQKLHSIEMQVRRPVTAKLRFVVANYDVLRSDKMAAKLASYDWDFVVADESHKLKAPGGLISKRVAKIGANRRSLLLTGTPMPHSPLDIFAQFRIINPDIYGTSFARFRNQYAKMGGWQGRQVLGYQNMDDFNRRLFSHTFQVGKEVLDLPEAHHIVYECTIAAKAAKVYADMRDELVVELAERPNDPILAQNVLVKMLRLQQITGGHIDGTEIDDSKAQLLAELLDGLAIDEPVVVFGRFTKDLDAIKRVSHALERPALELSGRINNLARWQAGEASVLAVQMQAGGVGIDLTRAAYCMYYSTGYSLGDYEQSLARVHRPGQTRTTFYFHLHATLPPNNRRTIDQTVARALKMRKRIVDAVMAGEILT